MSNLCCGSIAAASAGDTPNAALSMRLHSSTKPPWRTRLAMGSGRTGCAAKSQRAMGTSVTVSRPVAAMSRTALISTAPAGNSALMPPNCTLNLAEPTSDIKPLGALSGCAAVVDSAGWITATNCRAVGWSKIRVLGSRILSPTAVCSWLRSSTAPRESTPASIRGASASTEALAVCRTSSSTVLSPTAQADDAAADCCGAAFEALVRGANAE